MTIEKLSIALADRAVRPDDLSKDGDDRKRRPPDKPPKPPRKPPPEPPVEVPDKPPEKPPEKPPKVPPEKPPEPVREPPPKRPPEPPRKPPKPKKRRMTSTQSGKTARVTDTGGPHANQDSQLVKGGAGNRYVY